LVLPNEQQMNNIYNRGALANVREVLLPPSIYGGYVGVALKQD
jgi:hypothetical protein